MLFISTWLHGGTCGWFAPHWNELLLVRVLFVAHQTRNHGRWPLVGVGLAERYKLPVIAVGVN